MYLKIHISRGQRVIAACDKELIGMIIEDGNYYIDLKKYSSFYVGEICSKEELENALTNFNSASLVGEKVVSVALSKGVVSKEKVTNIKSFPCIQIYKV